MKIPILGLALRAWTLLALACTTAGAPAATAQTTPRADVLLPAKAQGEQVRGGAAALAQSAASLFMSPDTTYHFILPMNAYTRQLSAYGGSGTYTWSITGGALPPGWTLTPGGQLGGTAQREGFYAATIAVTSGGETVSRTFRFYMWPMVVIGAMWDQQPGIVGKGYSHTFDVSANSFYDDFAFRVTRGALPPGLTLSRSGRISGVPTATGSYSFGLELISSRQGIQGVQTTWGTTIHVYEAPRFTATVFPQAGVGVPYSASPDVTGGEGRPYMTFISPEQLPPGLTTRGNGVVHGTPTTPGQWTFPVSVSSAGTTIDANFTLAVLGFSSEAARPAGGTGIPYSDDIRATGALGSVLYSIESGQLPPGLALDSGSGMVRGTPTQAGSHAFTVAAASGGVTVTRSFTVTIIPPVAIVSGTERASAVVGKPYHDQLEASGGSGAFAWSVASGELPPGLVLSGGGLLSGTPTRSGTFEFSAQASSPPQSVTQSFRIVVHAAMSVTSESPLGAAEIGRPYQQTLTASGGDGSFRWAIAAGALPPGLSLSEEGAITGSPSAEGDFDFTVRCTSAGAEATRAFRITVYPVFSITSDSVRPAAAVGYPYGDRLQSAGGTGSASWSIAEGELPAGLALAPDGEVTGTPTTPGTYTFSARAASASLVRTRGFSIQVGPALAITSDSPRRTGTAGMAYADTLRASGGLGSPRWRVVEGGLPAGIRLDSISGALSGVPELEGESTFVAAAVTGSVQATRRFTISVLAPVLQPASVIDHLLGAGALDQDQVRYLDLQGNRNGRLDVGDVRAWLVRTRQLSPVRIPGLPFAGDASPPTEEDRR